MDVSAYKAVLFDVDKTLTNSKREFPDANKRMLSDLVKNGFIVGLCTGRQSATLQSVLSAFPEKSFHVICGGGQIITNGAQVLKSWFIPEETVKALVTLSSAHKCRLLLQYGSDLYGNEYALEHASNFYLSDSTFILPKSLEHLPSFAESALITVSNITDELLSEVQKLSVPIKVMAGYSGTRYMDITAPGVTKATGVLEWCSLHGIQPSEVIGFGDSENDLEFLQTVGLSVAMGNAVEELKTVADFVTEDCDHDGVAVWIEKNVLSTLKG